MSLANSLKARKDKRSQPLWKGPEEDGITFSLLSRFLVCRERFRLLVVEGLRPMDRWSHRTGYGDMWHVCEEALAAGADLRKVFAFESLIVHRDGLLQRYPSQQAEVLKWYEICRRQFPLYVEHWADNADVLKRVPLLQETAFNVPYKLPSGRVVRLRGKWDSVDLLPAHRENDRGFPKGVWLQENKTKGDVDEQMLVNQLRFDLQTMMYLVALTTPKPGDSGAGRNVKGWEYGANVLGVRYNVVRRPLSGGKGTIVQHKATFGSRCPKCKGVGGNCVKCQGAGRLNGKPEETAEHFFDRVAEYIKAEPDYFFFRWKSEVKESEITRFRAECLNPVLEQLCDWWQAINWHQGEYSPYTPMHYENAVSIHWRTPYGLYNPMLEGTQSDFDEYLNNGSEVGLHRVNNLFPELS